jgi:hypothetical protein
LLGQFNFNVCEAFKPVASPNLLKTTNEIRGWSM